MTTSELQLELLGRCVRGSVEPGVATWLTTLVESLPAASAVGVASSPFTIEVTSNAGAVHSNMLESDARDAPLGTRSVAVGTNEFWLLERVGVTEQGVHGRFEVGGAQLEVVGTGFAAWRALRQALDEVLAASLVVRVHAAAAHVDGATLALLGPSGRGKSTTLVRAAAAGWTPLAEDSIYVDVTTLTVIGADEYDHVRMRPAIADAGIELPDAPVPSLGTDGRLRIEFADLGGRLASARLTHLVHLVRRGASNPEWADLARVDAVMALHEAAGVPASRHAGRVLGAAFGDLVACVHTLQLELGDPRAPLPAPPYV